MIPCQVGTRFGYQRREFGNEVQGLKDDTSGSISVRRFQLITLLALGRQRQALF